MDEIGRKEFIQDLTFWMKDCSMIEDKDIFVISEPISEYGLTMNEVKTIVRREFGYEVIEEDGNINIVKRNYFGKVMLIDYPSLNAIDNVVFFNKEDMDEILKNSDISENGKDLLNQIFKDISENVFVGVYGIPYIDIDNEYIVVEEIFRKLNELKEKNNDWDFIISSVENEVIITKILSTWAMENDKLFFHTKYKMDIDIDNSNIVVIPSNLSRFVAEPLAVKLSQEFKNENWDKIWKTIQDYYILEEYSSMLEKLLKVAVKSRYYIQIDW